MNRPLLLIGAFDERTLAVLKLIGRRCTSMTRHRIEARVCKHREDWFDWLDEVEVKHSLSQALVLSDCAKFGADPLGVEFLGKEQELNLAAELALSYPESWFVFALPQGSDSGAAIPDRHLLRWDIESLKLLKESIELHGKGWRTWFDPWALRVELKRRQLVLPKASALFGAMNRRRKDYSAVAADDESIYALMNGYSLYRLGARCAIASTMGCFLHALERERPRILVADHQLEFPDLAPNIEDLREQEPPFKAAPEFWRLKQTQEVAMRWRRGWIGARASLSDGRYSDDIQFADPLGEMPWLILVSRTTIETENAVKELGDFAKGLELCSLLKPAGGPYDLASQICRSAKYGREWFQTGLYSGLIGEADEKSDNLVRHAALFGVHQIANRLLARARSLRASQPDSAEAHIFAALLASEAKELLGDHAQTTALAALQLQMECELRAELLSNATPWTIAAAQRLDALEIEAASIIAGMSEDSEVRRNDNSRLRDFLPQVVGSLRRQFAADMQLGEADDCLRRLWMYQLFPADLEAHALAKGDLGRFRDGTVWQNAWRDLRGLFTGRRLRPSRNSRGDEPSDGSRMSRLGLRAVFLATRGGTSFLRLVSTMLFIVVMWTFAFWILLAIAPSQLRDKDEKGRAHGWGFNLTTGLVSLTHSSNTFMNLLSGPVFVDEVLKSIIAAPSIGMVGGQVPSTAGTAVGASKPLGDSVPTGVANVGGGSSQDLASMCPLIPERASASTSTKSHGTLRTFAGTDSSTMNPPIHASGHSADRAQASAASSPSKNSPLSAESMRADVGHETAKTTVGSDAKAYPKVVGGQSTSPTLFADTIWCVASWQCLWPWVFAVFHFSELLLGFVCMGLMISLLYRIVMRNVA